MAETTYKKGELQDYEGNQLLPKTKAALVETGDGSNVEEKLKTFLPLGGGTMTGPAVGAAGDDGEAQFRNISYGTTDLTPGVTDLPEGSMYLFLDPSETVIRWAFAPRWQRWTDIDEKRISELFSRVEFSYTWRGGHPNCQSIYSIWSQKE